MSTLFEIFNQQPAPRPPVQPQAPAGLNIGSLMQFAKTLTGNPEMIVRSKLQNGQMTQQQFDALGHQASQIMRMFNLR